MLILETGKTRSRQAVRAILTIICALVSACAMAQTATLEGVVMRKISATKATPDKGAAVFVAPLTDTVKRDVEILQTFARLHEQRAVHLHNLSRVGKDKGLARDAQMNIPAVVTVDKDYFAKEREAGEAFERLRTANGTVKATANADGAYAIKLDSGKTYVALINSNNRVSAENILSYFALKTWTAGEGTERFSTTFNAL